jgi:autotransporter-associated beta strand protein
VNSSQTLTLSSGTQNFAGLIEGSGGVEIKGATQTLSGNNSSYAGPVTLSGGALNIGHENALGSGAFTNSTTTNTLTNTSGAAVTLSNSSYAFSSSVIFGGTASTADINTGSGDITLTGSQRILSVNNSAVKVTFGGAVSGDLRKDGAGTLVLAGNNTGLTGIRVTTGSLQLTGATAATTALIMGHPSNTNVGKFILGGTGGAVNQTFGSLSTEGGAQASQAIVGGNASVSTLTVDQSADTTYAGILGGGLTNENKLGLTKQGSGKLALSGTNSYTGDTTIKAGTLALGSAGTLASTNLIVGDTGSTTAVLDVSAKTGGFTIGSNQKLSGIGTVDANDGATKYTVTIDGTHAAGNSVGKQTIDGHVNYASSTSIFEWELGANVENGTWDHDNDSETAQVNTRGSAFDAVDITGNLAVNETTTTGAIFKIVLGTAFDGSNAFWTASRSWDVFNVTGTSSTEFKNFALYDSTNLTTPVSYDAFGSFGYSFASNTGTLTWTAVPEPTTALAGILLTFGLLRRRRG